ncbi:hypothetical protein DFQ30_001495 [Apophysomyces sp. BC1015]|nr:hypothetical protein DFQ30_001495 [Apophysomyces sp. BC1015]
MTPLIMGASAVLLYGAIDSPLAQPRNAFCGHVIGAVVGVIINVLFVQLPHFASQEQQIAVRWVGGATAMALTLVLSQMGNVVHPPAGATALIAVVSDSSVQEGWFYIAHVIICICLQLGVALLVNNIEKRYPVYWWTPSVPAPPSTPSQKEVLSVIEEGRNSDIINLKNLDYNEGGILLLPGQPIIYPSNIILDPEEQEILNRIHAKIDAHASQ